VTGLRNSGRSPGITRRQREALTLLREHGLNRGETGDGVVTSAVTGLDSGQPWINFHTARALERKGLARIDYSWDYPEIVLTEAGRATS
jgi:hypothetical protein